MMFKKSKIHRRKQEEQQKMQESYEQMYPKRDDLTKTWDKKIMAWLDEINLTYCDAVSLQDLKEKHTLPVNEKDGKWTVYQSICYYGGCEFNPIEFTNEYEAYKYARIKALLNAIAHRKHALSGATIVLADVNYNCPNYSECSGICLP